MKWTTPILIVVIAGALMFAAAETPEQQAARLAQTELQQGNPEAAAVAMLKSEKGHMSLEHHSYLLAGNTLVVTEIDDDGRILPANKAIFTVKDDGGVKGDSKKKEEELGELFAYVGRKALH